MQHTREAELWSQCSGESSDGNSHPPVNSVNFQMRGLWAGLAIKQPWNWQLSVWGGCMLPALCICQNFFLEPKMGILGVIPLFWAKRHLIVLFHNFPFCISLSISPVYPCCVSTYAQRNHMYGFPVLSSITYRRFFFFSDGHHALPMAMVGRCYGLQSISGSLGGSGESWLGHFSEISHEPGKKALLIGKYGVIGLLYLVIPCYTMVYYVLLPGLLMVIGDYI